MTDIKNKINDFLNSNQKYLLITGDSLEILEFFPNQSIDFIFTDPPYNIRVGQGGGTLGRSGKLLKMSNELEAINIAHGYDILAYSKLFRRICKNGMNLAIWLNKMQFKDYFNLYVNEYNYNFNLLTWHKTNPLPSYSHKYLTDTEYLLNFSSPGHVNPANYHDAISYYVSPLNSKDKKLYEHPTIKPLDFTERVLRNHTHPGDIVLDCFMGSGTVGVAAIKNNRRFIGIEAVSHYQDIAEKRIKEALQLSSDSNFEDKKKFKFGLKK